MQSKPIFIVDERTSYMQSSTGYIAVNVKPYDLSKFSWWFGV